MGQGALCRRACIWQLYALHGQAWRLYQAIRRGDWERVEQVATALPKLVSKALFPGGFSALHVAALHGQLEVLAVLLERGANANCANCTGQTPLILASKAGKWSCVHHLLQQGGNVLLFDAPSYRTCLHYAAEEGHVECVQSILSAVQCGPVDDSWGPARFVNSRDSKGRTALHLAASRGHVAVLQLLLATGALVCATTISGSGRTGQGSTPLHTAARGGSAECVQELLAWGADRNQRDASGRTAYALAKRRKNKACAALLDPRIAEPLVWPTPCKFMGSLDVETRKLLEEALKQANHTRRLTLTAPKAPASDQVEDENEDETCSICFEHLCSLQVQDCGHQMCATCILTLCCRSKPSPANPFSPPPLCPFCRSSILLITLMPSKTPKLR